MLTLKCIQIFGLFFNNLRPIAPKLLKDFGNGKIRGKIAKSMDYVVAIGKFFLPTQP